MEPEAAPIRRRLVGKQPPPQAYGGATVTVKAALTDEEKLLLQMPGGISPAEVAQRIAQASGLEPEAVSLMLDGSPLAGTLPHGSVEVLMLERSAFAQLNIKLLSLGVPSGSWLLVTFHDETRVQIINLESRTTLASIFYPEFKPYVTQQGTECITPDYEAMFVDSDTHGPHSCPAVHEALHKYVRECGWDGFPPLERVDPLRNEDMGVDLPGHLTWMGDEANFPPGARAFADEGYAVAQL